MRRILSAAIFGVATMLSLWMIIGWSHSSRTEEFRPQVVIRRPFPPITDIPVMSAAEADRQLRPAELVLGVTVGEHARAYPINMLTGPRREIINDELGGAAIAATW